MRTDPERPTRVRAGRVAATLVVAVAAAYLTGCGPRATTRPADPGVRPGGSMRATRTPVDVARAYNAACKAGDLNGAAALARADTKEERDYLTSAVEVGAATERLKRAIVERFGKDADLELDFGLPADEEFDDAVARVEGDRATVVMGEWKDVKDLPADHPGTVRLRRVAGQWRVEPAPGGVDATAELRNQTLMNRVFARSADLTAAEVRAGKFTTPADAAGAFRGRPFDDPDAFEGLRGPGR